MVRAAIQTGYSGCCAGSWLFREQQGVVRVLTRDNKGISAVIEGSEKRK